MVFLTEDQVIQWCHQFKIDNNLVLSYSKKYHKKKDILEPSCEELNCKKGNLYIISAYIDKTFLYNHFKNVKKYIHKEEKEDAIEVWLVGLKKYKEVFE